MERRASAKSASSVLYEDVNDIDIYVEDTALGYKKLYKEMLKRVFQDDYKIEQIFPLGNSDTVIKECEKYQTIDDNRLKLFIIDGDFFLLNQNLKEKIAEAYREDIKGLFILPRYCIENFFLEEDVLLQIINEEDGEKELHQISENINFNNWIQENRDILIELWIIYSIVYLYIPEVQTVGFKVANLCSDDSGIVDKAKAETRIEELKIKLLTVISEEQLNAEIQSRMAIVQSVDNGLLRFISGKDYLLPLMKTRIRNAHKFGPNEVSFKNRLSQRCNVGELLSMKDFVFKYLP